ncbi:MAG: large repetitive protein [Solirubrobacteraceae bacterium]|nr:large repetitive protein [Solirubrobacteraceae bacterium]
MVCSPSGRTAAFAVVVAVDDPVFADFARTLAKLRAPSTAAVRAAGVPPVFAAEMAWVGSIIDPVVGPGGANLSPGSRPYPLPAHETRRFSASLPITGAMRLASALRPLLAAGAVLALLAVPADAAAPAATGLPAISGTTRAGQTLTSTTGIFSGAVPLTYVRSWQRCDTAGAACAPIVGASATTYVAAAADVGTTLRVAVTATNIEGSATASSAATPIVAPAAPPTNDAGGLPVVSGTARDGQVLSAIDGAWSGTAPLTFTRLWRRCDAAGASCTGLAGAATHTLTSADVGATIRVDVTGHNADGQGVATSAQTAVVDAAPPVSAVAPAMTGPARSGQTLISSTTGTWTGTTPMTYARQWTRCDAGGGSCVPIAGAVGSTYLVTDADIGATIRVALTATNISASATASSAASATVGPKVPPLKTVDPAISGAAIDGQILTATDGSWSGTPTITTTRRWQRCAALGLGCADLAATSTTLTLTSADVGSTLRTVVTATNPDGTTQATSAVTLVVAAAIPSTTVAPAVSGTAREGQVLSATQGTWKGTPTISYAYGWERCNAGSCSAIAGESATTYRLAAADLGRTVRATVTASNGGGTTTVPSAQTATVTGGVPVSLAVPDISAPLPRDGELYSSTLGTWGGTAPLLTARQWLRCNATGASCTAISGEVAATYTVVGADLGKTLRLEVSATNAFGAAKAQSAPSPVILAAPPTTVAAPVIAGILRDGQTLTATSSWSGTAPIALSWQWQRCDAVAATCTDLAAATAVTYRLTSADVGARMRVRVGALNAGGGGTATSVLAVAGDPAGLVAPDPPHAATAPALTGSAIEGATLTSTDGTFTGTTPITTATRWQRCDGAGASCADVAGAVGPDYFLTGADRGATVRSVVTAVNGSGSDSSASAPSAVVAMAPPRNVVAPAVSPYTGLRDGATVLSTDGGWAGSQPMTLAYRWQHCTSPTACVDIAGAHSASLMLVASDAGFSLRIVITASNGAGATSQASALTGLVGTNPPVSVTPPTVAGTARDGDVLTTVDGVWTGPIVYQTTYEWWRCDVLGDNCTVIPGATAASTVVSAADIGLTLRARITRTSTGGQTAAFSAPTATVVAAAPSNLTTPQITGPAGVGRTLVAVRGSWTGTGALAYTYQWQNCATDGSACADAAGATSATYDLTAADAATTVRVVVIATNAFGAASATSAATAEVQTDPPSTLTAPRIVTPAGPLAVGATLSSQPGTWDGALPIALTYQWARCDAPQTGCAAISGATATSYALVAADVGKRIVLTVTATNVVDTTVVLTDPTAAVLPAPPSNVGPPAVTAGAGTRVGGRLTATTGTWAGATPMIYATTWLRCAADGTGCAAIDGAGATSYTLTEEDLGRRIRARVTATNVTTDVTAESLPTGAVTPAPVVAVRPPAVTPAPTPAPTTPVPTTKLPTTTIAPVTTKTGTATTTTKTKTTTKTATAKTAAAKKKAAAAKKKAPAAKKKAPAAKKKTTTAKTKATAPKKTAAAHRDAASAIPQLERLRITPGGVLLAVLRCPRWRTHACAASGTIVAGTALGEVIPDTPLTFAIRPGSVAKGKSRTCAFKLTTAQRAALQALSTVNFRVRLAVPSKPTHVDEVFVHTSVPAQLRGD